MMTEDPATQWNRQEIIKKLVELEHNQKILSPRAIRHSNPALYCAVFRNFGCWSSALAAAGIRSPRAPRKKKRRTKSICWTKETIIEMILECAVKRQPMLSSKIRPVSLRNAAIKTFGSWAEAVRAAGLEAPTSEYQKWNKERVKKELLARLKAGKSIYPHDICKENRRLRSAISRCFDNWADSFLYAGICPGMAEKTRKKWED